MLRIIAFCGFAGAGVLIAGFAYDDKNPLLFLLGIVMFVVAFLISFPDKKEGE